MILKAKWLLSFMLSLSLDWDYSFPSKEKDCSAELVTITKSDINKGYVILEGEYYNSLSCITGLYQNATYVDYIVPKDYKLDENSYSQMK